MHRSLIGVYLIAVVFVIVAILIFTIAPAPR